MPFLITLLILKMRSVSILDKVMTQSLQNSIVASRKVAENSASEIKSAKACKLFVSSILQPVF